MFQMDFTDLKKSKILLPLLIGGGFFFVRFIVISFTSIFGNYWLMLFISNNIVNHKYIFSISFRDQTIRNYMFELYK